ncbi:MULTISPECIES: hypothetical protein [unclassified Leisingera]|uniref:hypothetical protein n=1 Tax=unclassified Leisingera TaxID=2614906 RepID=UPI0002F0E840|nr:MULTISPECIES: hypothetical protein [unclassified Leisingera]KIC16638.1 hypothetical protein RA21_13510 [Leisingera sp. ANG-DT]KIC24794.1 hypothetical protein RA23_09645 [Leisingera sp. ANG-S3]KIC55350.1 hypothetical protein RA22_00965 [Leisingera sp. ANG-S]KID09082.1 hypothetical protein GC1_10350 [Leisingera sp. ANG1]
MGIVFGYVALVVSGFTAIYAVIAGIVMGHRLGKNEVPLKSALSVTFLPVLLVPMVIYLIVAAFHVGEMGQGVVTLSGILGAAFFMERLSMSFLMPLTAAVFSIALIVARLRRQNSQRGL